MPQVESLTVQILGDSAGLQEELNAVAGLLDDVVQQISVATEGVGGFGDSFGNLSNAMTPLQGLSNQLSLLVQQIQQVSSLSISLNVQPALDALAMLMQNAQAAAVQLQALSNLPIGNPFPGGSGFGGFPGGAGPALGPISGGNVRAFLGASGPQMFAGGGLVTGPSGIDQVAVAARLTAGEYVLNPDAVRTIGLTQLESWNRGSPRPLVTVPEPMDRVIREPDGLPVEQRRSRGAELQSSVQRPSLVSPVQGRHGDTITSTLSQTTNHFGGIQIHVNEASELDEVMQTIRRQGIGIRQRRG